VDASRPTPAPPVVIAPSDLPASAARPQVVACEDCACPAPDAVLVDAARPTAAQVRAARWVRAPEVLEIDLEAGHRLLFNPDAAGGAVVANAAALGVLDRFARTPATPTAEQDEAVDAALVRFVEAGVLRPPGRGPVVAAPQQSGVLTAWLHVTNACNLRCPYCYIDKTDEGMADETGLAAVDALVRAAVEHGFGTVKLKYAGGEATLNHHLVLALHDYAAKVTREQGLELQGVVLSNGVALSARLVHELRDRGIRVMVSLDGIGEAHDVQRPTRNGRGTSALVVRTIRRMIDLGLPPHLSITLTNRNLGGLAEVTRFALDHGLTFSFNFFRDNDCAASFDDLRFEEGQLIAAIGEAFAVIEERPPPWSVLGSVLDRGQLLQPRTRSCGVGQDYVVVDQRGKIAKCHMEIERTIGDVLTDDPLLLVRQDTTSVQNLLVDDKEGCRSCTWRNWCAGGCSVATFRATGRFDIKSPNCNIYKAIYPMALRLEGLRLLRYADDRAGPAGHRCSGGTSR
jgi:uncharacterized protein